MKILFCVSDKDRKDMYGQILLDADLHYMKVLSKSVIFHWTGGRMVSKSLTDVFTDKECVIKDVPSHWRLASIEVVEEGKTRKMKQACLLVPLPYYDIIDLIRNHAEQVKVEI